MFVQTRRSPVRAGGNKSEPRSADRKDCRRAQHQQGSGKPHSGNGDDTITERVKNDDPVTIVGFGTFKLQHKPQRTGRNPATGATITIAEKYVPKFVPGAAFKAAVER